MWLYVIAILFSLYLMKRKGNVNIVVAIAYLIVVVAAVLRAAMFAINMMD